MDIKHYFLMTALLVISSQASIAQTIPKTVVACSAESCPMISPLLGTNEQLTNQIIVYQTSNKPEFMLRESKSFTDSHNDAWHQIEINQSEFKDVYPIIGFGGAFTDSTAIIYKNMVPSLQRAFIDSYFSSEGITYSLGRVPMGSSDFSCRAEGEQKDPLPSLNSCSDKLTLYSYEDMPGKFLLQSEDINFKIPMIHAANAALKASGEELLRLFASPWSAPAWMKTNASMINGNINPQFQQLWADYFVKFLAAYKQYDISFWGVTVQNEPDEAALLNSKGFQWWQTMYYTAADEGNFVKNYLGPTLAAYQKVYGTKINLIVHDDLISSIHKRISMLDDPNTAEYVDGVGLHWYLNIDLLFSNLDKTYESLKSIKGRQRFILGTEASDGYSFGPSFGSWSRGEAYAHDIITDLNHHVSGWTDWNLLLDMNGGPNWAKNYVDAPILFDLEKQTFYKQPMYYYLGHFSKFIRPGAKLLSSSSKGPIPLEEVTFKVPAHGNLPETIVIVVLNRSLFGCDYYIKDNSKLDQNKYLNMHIPAHSIQTIVYKAVPITRA